MCEWYDCYVASSGTKQVLLRENSALFFLLSMILVSIFLDSAQAKKYVVAVPPFKIRPFRFYHGVCHS